jgi:hypothetical protein
MRDTAQREARSGGGKGRRERKKRDFYWDAKNGKK